MRFSSYWVFISSGFVCRGGILCSFLSPDFRIGVYSVFRCYLPFCWLILLLVLFSIRLLLFLSFCFFSRTLSFFCLFSRLPFFDSWFFGFVFGAILLSCTLFFFYTLVSFLLTLFWCFILFSLVFGCYPWFLRT